jgi:hypothetical protein
MPTIYLPLDKFILTTIPRIATFLHHPIYLYLDVFTMPDSFPHVPDTCPIHAAPPSTLLICPTYVTCVHTPHVKHTPLKKHTWVGVYFMNPTLFIIVK